MADSGYFSRMVNGWLEAGLQKGDTVLLHSDVTRSLIKLRRNQLPAKSAIILDSFLQAIGEEGTLMLPTFNMGFTKGLIFDVRKTPSEMGVLTELGRLHKDSVRTGHPIYSFAVMGANKGMFEGLNNKSSFSDTSPFAVLRKLNGKIAALDIEDGKCMTFYHHVEEVKKVSYRYSKDFTAPYVDWSGYESIKTYQMYVRDLKQGVVADLNPMGELLWREGLYNGDLPGKNTGLRVISAKLMFDFVATKIDEGRSLGLLYRIDR